MRSHKAKTIGVVSRTHNLKEDVAQVELKEILAVVMIFIVIGIAAAYGLEVTDDARDDIGADACAGRSDTYTSYNTTANQCYNSSGSHVEVGNAEFNATGDAIQGTAKITSKLPTIGTVIGAAVILTILVRYLYMRFVQ